VRISNFADNKDLYGGELSESLTWRKLEFSLISLKKDQTLEKVSLFLGLLLVFTTAYNIKVLVSGYPSINVHCIVLPVKFDGGLSISALRNKQLFKNNGVQKFISRHLKKGRTIALEKVSLFLSHFSCERNRQPTFEFDKDLEMCFIYRLIPRKPNFVGWLVDFDTTPDSRFSGPSQSVHGRIQHIMLVYGYQSIDMHCIM
jgi:hypothetical protein